MSKQSRDTILIDYYCIIDIIIVISIVTSLDCCKVIMLWTVSLFSYLKQQNYD